MANLDKTKGGEKVRVGAKFKPTHRIYPSKTDVRATVRGYHDKKGNEITVAEGSTIKPLSRVRTVKKWVYKVL